MPQKVVSPASAIGGEVMRNGCVGYRVKPKRSIKVIERLRAQIRCIEGRTPALDPAKPAIVQALGAITGGPDGSMDDTVHPMQGTHGTTPLCASLPDQAGVPAIRFAHEDGGALFPHNAPAPPSSSFFSAGLSEGRSTGLRASQDRTATASLWTLADAPAMMPATTSRHSLAHLALDAAGVHEIKPAGHTDACSARSNDRVAGALGVAGTTGAAAWAAAWSAARAFVLMLMARRRAAIRRPVLWCMPRSARTEHGFLYGHGLRPFGLTPGDVLIVETGTPQDTLWVLEEGLKSESLALVAGLIDDVALTPARRLALAAQKCATPCLLLTHPRMPPVGATATRWRIGPACGAPHPLSAAPAAAVPTSPMRRGYRQGLGGLAGLGGLGARRLAVTLERYRAAPRHVTGQEHIMEWSDEAVCLRLVAGVSDRPDAARVPARGA